MEGEREQRNERVARVASFVLVILPMILSALAGLIVVGHQCLDWLRFGHWQEMTFQDALYWIFGHPFYSQTGWLGIDKIVQWSVDSLSLALWFIIILPIIWRVIWFMIVAR